MFFPNKVKSFRGVSLINPPHEPLTFVVGDFQIDFLADGWKVAAGWKMMKPYLNTLRTCFFVSSGYLRRKLKRTSRREILELSFV